MSIPRSEHPRPQFKRNDWLCLNGAWDYRIDNSLSGIEREFYNEDSFEGEIILPFCPESKLSGIGNTDFINGIWYLKRLTLPEAWQEGRVHLNVGACDYEAIVFVNGKRAGEHFGGYIGFSIDITDHLVAGENKLVIFAKDDVRSRLQPKGKQADKYYSSGCDYTRTTGIWQSVWLEHTPENYIKSIKLTPSLKNCKLLIEAETLGDGELCAELFYEGKFILKSYTLSTLGSSRMIFDIPVYHPWSLGNPNLYDLRLTFCGDEIESYFGLRDIEYRDGKTYLNGRPIFQRLILDQGFYPDGIYTAPSDEELVNDILRSKAMGFNGARLHQKVFEPRFLYHCDRLGYLVWGEHANWGLDLTSSIAYEGFVNEWLEILKRDYNHPSIIGWCPLNETPSNVNPKFVKFLYAQTKAFDPTRLFIDNSGWRHIEGCYDIYDVHDYEQDPERLKAKIEALERGEEVEFISALFYDNHFSPENVKLKAAPFFSEFGGIQWSLDKEDGGWGYGNAPKTEEEFLERFKGLCEALLFSDKISAFCYTQLTDIEQEQNGLYTYDRKPKFPPEKIAEIVSQKAEIEKCYLRR